MNDSGYYFRPLLRGKYLSSLSNPYNNLLILIFLEFEQQQCFLISYYYCRKENKLKILEREKIENWKCENKTFKKFATQNFIVEQYTDKDNNLIIEYWSRFHATQNYRRIVLNEIIKEQIQGLKVFFLKAFKDSDMLILKLSDGSTFIHVLQTPKI